MLNSEQRRKYLLDCAEENGSVCIPDAARHFDVSVETVRRDVNRLCGEGLLRKVHGGAVPVRHVLRRDTGYASRINRNQREKAAIGAAAARMITDGSVVILDCGVSIQAVAENVADLQNVTFITNSVPTAAILLEKHAAGAFTGQIILIGGRLNCENRFATGAAAVETLGKYYADIAFLSCTAVSAQGASAYDPDEGAYSAAALCRSRTRVLIAESEKFGKDSVCRYAELSDFTAVVTDSANELPGDTADAAAAAGCTLTVVKKSEG